jgi:hypothetical protein
MPNENNFNEKGIAEKGAVKKDILQHERVIASALDFIKKKYAPVMVLLYGSFADNTDQPSSDVDVLAFSDIPEMVRETGMLEIRDPENRGQLVCRPMDAWIYPAEKLKCPKEFMHVFQGICLYDRDGVFPDFHKAVVREKDLSVKPFTGPERHNMENWIDKMLVRCRAEDAEAYYRYNWLKQDFLELYCKYSTCYYAGPKRTLKLLEEMDPNIYSLYFDLLRSMKDPQGMQELYWMIMKKGRTS